ncbi:hypothetical protein B7494_g6180 [Chlorociboria aeruginascens]|nr:hypothetical protein B7494_g6180 [Chlorociboria aeruginascens]
MGVLRWAHTHRLRLEDDKDVVGYAESRGVKVGQIQGESSDLLKEALSENAMENEDDSKSAPTNTKPRSEEETPFSTLPVEGHLDIYGKKLVDEALEDDYSDKSRRLKTSDFPWDKSSVEYINAPKAEEVPVLEESNGNPTHNEIDTAVADDLSPIPTNTERIDKKLVPWSPLPAQGNLDTTEEGNIDRALEDDFGPEILPYKPLQLPTGDESSFADTDDQIRETYGDNELVKALGKDSISPSVHILGSGPAGQFIASTLAGIPDPPSVTLLLHRPLHLQKWYDEGQAIKLFKDGLIIDQPGINIEAATHFSDAKFRPLDNNGYSEDQEELPPDTVIDNLIVTTDGYRVVSALTAVKHRIRRSSTIVFMQGGLGVIDLVNTAIFPFPEHRPTYMLGNSTHSFISTDRKYAVALKQQGSMEFLILPRKEPVERNQQTGFTIRKVFNSPQWTANSKNLLRTLCRTPELKARGCDTYTFLRSYMEFLAVNSVIGPLSVLFDCSNDKLLSNYHVTQAMQPLLSEISYIIRSLPELSKVPHLDHQFSSKTLERVVLGVCMRTGGSLSKMLQAVRLGERTDIDFYNGYLHSRASELGIECPRNEMVISLVKGKQMIKKKENDSYIPFAEDD